MYKGKTEQCVHIDASAVGEICIDFMSEFGVAELEFVVSESSYLYLHKTGQGKHFCQNLQLPSEILVFVLRDFI
jgi:hypothetical protein